MPVNPVWDEIKLILMTQCVISAIEVAFLVAAIVLIMFKRFR